MTNNDIISFNIKRCRKNLNLTQLDVSKQFGVTLRTYIYIENDPASRTFKELEKLANILNVDITEFFLNLKVNNSHN